MDDGDQFMRIETYSLEDSGFYDFGVNPYNGNSEYCDYWDDLGSSLLCEHGESDCDSDDECEPGLECMGPIGDIFGNSYDGCCYPDEAWDPVNSVCIDSCDAGYVNEYRCDTGNWVQRKYINSDCSYEWRDQEDCDDRDDETGPWGSNYCPDSSTVKKDRDIYDYYCKSSIADCSYTTSTDTEVVSSLGDTNFCDRREDASCSACTYEQYDCNEDDECSGSLQCVGSSFCAFNECGCCPSDEDWASSDEECCFEGVTENDYCSSIYNRVQQVTQEVVSGSCTSITEVVDYCSSTEYCTGGDCVQCDTGTNSCDGFCPSEYCYNDDDDCDANGNIKDCCGNGICVVGEVCPADSQGTEVCDEIDNDCDGNVDEGFNLMSDENNCGTCGNTCDQYYVCTLGNCEPDFECGNGVCEDGEVCPQECLEVVQIVNPPILVNPADSLTIRFEVTNEGTETMTSDFEAAIFPNIWSEQNLMMTLAKGVLTPIASCCNTNEYVSAASITLSGGETDTFSLNIQVPNYYSVDACNNDRSAWDDSFELISGFYNQCGDGYSSVVKEPINIRDVCNGNGICEAGETSTNCVLDCICDFDNICESPENENSCPSDCGCNGNNICEADRGESIDSCSADCGCNDNDVCEEQRGEDVSFCQDCAPDCPVPTGDNRWCDCDSNEECEAIGDYYCDFVSGYDACEAVNYVDECNNYNDYYCEEGDVYLCSNNGLFYEEQPIDSCTFGNKYCDPQVVDGTGVCSSYVNNLNIWLDQSSVGTKLYKRAGDKVTLNIYSETAGTTTIQLDSKIIGNCPDTIVAGVNTCELSIREDTFGLATITVAREEVIIEIISGPKVLFVTDSKKLKQRYLNEQRGVDALLHQAYQIAEKNYGIVYDMNDYNFNHPFSLFYEYNENPFVSNYPDNTYINAVSNFIKEKCNGCEDVIILGDDYVIPYYRNEITRNERNWWLIGSQEEVEHLYSDSEFVNRELTGFNDFFELFKQGEGYQGKNVLVLMPEGASQEMYDSVQFINQTLFDLDYDPDFYYEIGNEINCFDNTWRNTVKGKTLMFVGTYDTNPAYNCMNFFPSDVGSDEVVLQRNPWDNNEYALVLYTDDPVIAEMFGYLISNPDNLANLRSEGAYFAKVGVQYAGYVAMTAGAAVVIVGSGGTVAAILGGAAVVLDTAADAGDISNDCYINKEGAGWCATSVVVAILPQAFSRPVKKFLKEIADFDLSVIRNIGQVNHAINKNLKTIPTTTFSKAIKNEVDLEDFGKGHSLLGDQIVLTELPVASRLAHEDMIDVTRAIGRLDNAVDPKILRKAELLTSNNQGKWAEIIVADRALSDPNDLIRIGKKLTTPLGETDIDIIYREGDDVVIAEVKDWTQNFFTSGKNELKTIEKIRKFRYAIEVGDEVDTGIVANKAAMYIRNDVNLPQSILDEMDGWMELKRFEGVSTP